MKCPVCGYEVRTGNVCTVCGCNVVGSSNTPDQYSVYTGSAEVNKPSYTRSKTIALLLAFVSLNDLYLFEWARFFYKLAAFVFTCGIGALIWQIMDIINIATGKINQDAHGNPIV